MVRRRYQKPTPQRRGRQWVILVREDEIVEGQPTRRLRRVGLGPATLSRAEAERLRDDYVAPLNEPALAFGGAIAFRDFVRIYVRDVLSMYASTTQARAQSVLKNHLIPAFGDLILREITLERLQAYFARLQQSALSAESLDKIRDVMSGVLRTAVEYGRLHSNPVEKVRLRRRKRISPKPFLRVEQYDMLEQALAEPYATMVYVAMFTGLRVSELTALRWRHLTADSITVEERFHRGDWDQPKTASSRATISVAEEVIQRIFRLKELEVVVRAGRAKRRYPVVKSAGPDDLVFQSLVTGSALRDNNVLSHHIKPAARKLGLGWVNWQVLRRSFATWLQQAGVDVKDAQGLMRHSRASTTQDLYQQVVSESQRAAVEKLSCFVRRARTEIEVNTA